MPAEEDKLAQDEQVEEDGEAGSGEPGGVGEDITSFVGDDKDGDDVGDVFYQFWSVLFGQASAGIGGGGEGMVQVRTGCERTRFVYLLPEMEKKNMASDRPAHRVLLSRQCLSPSCIISKARVHVLVVCDLRHPAPKV